VCTAILSIEPGAPVLLAGVRDELTDRAWQPPGRHWPDHPGLIGGRDLLAGGTWLALDPEVPRVACVLNGRGRPAPASSRRTRGVLPLLAASGTAPEAAGLPDVDPFHLLSAEPGQAVLWSWDGKRLRARELGPGLHIVVPGGLASELPAASSAPRSGDGRPGGGEVPVVSPAVVGVDGQPVAGDLPVASCAAPDGDGQPHAVEAAGHELARIAHFGPLLHVAARPAPRPGDSTTRAWGDWLRLMNGAGVAASDPRALIVRHEIAGRVYGTTSVSLVSLSPEGARYDFTGTPGERARWYPVPLPIPA
jgi:transport and Golgi organization protein 2